MTWLEQHEAFAVALMLSFCAHLALGDLLLGKAGHARAGQGGPRSLTVVDLPAPAVRASLPAMAALVPLPATQLDTEALLPLPPTQGSGLLAMREPGYLKARELSQRPKPLEEPRIDAPEFQEGRPVVELRVRIFIDETGRVENARLDGDVLPDAFAESVLRAASAIRFTPGLRDGQPVKSQIVMGFRFVAQKDAREAVGMPLN